MGNMVIQKIKVCPALSDKEVTATRKTVTPTSNLERATFIYWFRVSRRRLTFDIDHDEMQR